MEKKLLIIVIVSATFVGLSQRVQTTTESEKNTPLMEQRTMAFDHYIINKKNVELYFKTPLVIPSHMHIEPQESENHEEDWGDGETILQNNGLMMRRDMKPGAPSEIYRIRYKNCVTAKKCETGYFYKEIKN